jgi:dienelactone hydrolase
LIADQFAANGYFVMMPDLFNRDPIPLPQPENFNVDKWRAGPPGHGPHTVDPIVSAIIKEMKDNLGVKRLGAVGYCFWSKVYYQILEGQSN